MAWCLRWRGVLSLGAVENKGRWLPCPTPTRGASACHTNRHLGHHFKSEEREIETRSHVIIKQKEPAFNRICNNKRRPCTVSNQLTLGGRKW